MTRPGPPIVPCEASSHATVRSMGVVVLLVALCLGASWERNRLYENGRWLWEDVVAKSPGKVRGYNNLGTVYQGMKLHDKALQIYQRAMEVDPYTSLHAYGNIGNVYIDMKEYEKAAGVFTRILAIDTRDYQSYAGRGKAWYWLGRYRDAAGEFSRALAINPKISRYYLYRAEAYVKLDDLMHAREDLATSCGMGWQESCDRLEELEDE